MKFYFSLKQKEEVVFNFDFFSKVKTCNRCDSFTRLLVYSLYHSDACACNCSYNLSKLILLATFTQYNKPHIME